MQNPAYAIDQQPCSPSAYYAAACDPQRHIAIEACAGAGKTWILVSRILRALFAGAKPQNILAITFTKKAAGEMQQRLSEWLAEFAQAGDERLQQELQARGIAQPSAADIARLRGLQAQLWQHPKGVQIRTFHGWFTALLQSAPLAVFQALELPYPFSLFEDDSALIAQVWPSFYQALEADPAAAQDYADLIADLGMHNSHTALAHALDKRLELSLGLAAGVPQRSLPPLDQAYPDLAEYAGDLQRALQTGTRVHSALTQALHDLPADSSAKTIAQARQALQAGLQEADFARCWQALMTQSGSPRKNLPDSQALRQATSLLEHLQDWQNHASALQHQGRMLRLSQLLIAQYQAMKRARGWLDMVDVELAARKLLTDSALASWMQERLDAQVRHLLIDEFQDTSPLQWQILKDWLSNYTGAGGGSAMPSIFLVGDPKQSIYRFRNAEPRVFMDAQALVQSLGGALLSCEHTRRNAPAIINELNAVLGAAQMLGFRPHTTESQAQGQILAQCFERPEKSQGSAEDSWRDSLSTPQEPEESPTQAAECEAIAQWLARQIAQGQAPQDFMVLARKRERLKQLYQHLCAYGLPALLAEKSHLPEHLEVQDIMALMDVLHSPERDMALAQVLKSPIFGWSDADLVQVALAAQQASSTWWQALQAGQQAAWQNLMQQLLRWQGWLLNLPIYDALFAIYHDGDLPARYAQAVPAVQRARVSANLQGLLQAALNFAQGRFSHSWQFVRALRQPHEQSQFPAPTLAQADAIQLLTVHGAKGLEAEHVILLDTLPAAKKSSSYGLLCDWPAQAATPQSIIFYRSGSAHPAHTRHLLAAEAQLQERDELNGLYVAMTRARQRLVFSATAMKNPNRQAWWQLLQQHGLGPYAPISAEDQQKDGCKDEGKNRASTDPIPPQPSVNATHCQVLQLPRLPAPAQAAGTASSPSLVPGGADDSPEAAHKLAARRGQALHRILEWGISQPEGDAWQQRLMRDYALDAQTCLELLAQAQVLRSGGGAWVWDSNRISWAGNEVDIAHQGQLLRLDRLVQEASTGCWWVVDYKSAFAPELQTELHAQMHSYIAAVQAAQPTATVRGAWIAGDGRWVEFAA